MSIQAFCPFFNLVVGFLGVELYELFIYYILDINPLLAISFANILSYSVG